MISFSLLQSKYSKPFFQFFVVFFFLSIVLFFRFSDIVSNKSTFLLPGDTLDLVYPDMKFIVDSYKNSTIPWWNPHQFMGYPMVGYPQYGIFYPGLIITSQILRIFNLSFSQVAYNFYVLTHLLIAGLGVYVLLRSLRIDYLSSIVGSLTFMLSPSLLKFVVWANQLPGLALMPWVLACVYMWLTAKNFSKKYYALSVLSLSVLFSSTPAQPSIQIVFILVLLMSWFALKQFFSREVVLTPLQFFGRLVISVRNILLIIIPAALFNSLMFLSVFEFTRLSVRFLGSDGSIQGFSKMPFNAFVSHRFFRHNIGGFLDPVKSLGGVASTFYGLIPLTLIFLYPVIYLSFKKLRNKLYLFWYFFAVFSIIYTYGKVFPVFFYHVPFLNIIREPERYSIFVCLSLSVLVGTAVNAFLTVISRPVLKLLFLIIIIFFLYRDMSRFAYPSLPLTALNVDRYYISHQPLYDYFRSHNGNSNYRYTLVESSHWPISTNMATLYSGLDTFGYGNPVLTDIYKLRIDGGFCSEQMYRLGLRYLITDFDSDSRINNCKKYLNKAVQLKAGSTADYYRYPLDKESIINVYEFKKFLPRVYSLDKNTIISNIVEKSSSISFKVDGLSLEAITVANYYYPGWKYSINGLEARSVGSDKMGLISVPLLPINSQNIHVFYLPNYLNLSILLLALTFIIFSLSVLFLPWSKIYVSIFVYLPLFILFLLTYLNLQH